MSSRNTILLPALLGVAVIACLSGCASQRTPALVEAAPVREGAVTTATGPYRLRVGDEVEVDFLTDETLDFEGPVTPTGSLSVPLIGEVPAAGRSTIASGQAATPLAGVGYRWGTPIEEQPCRSTRSSIAPART